ncbi:MAG: hypothetical protein EOO45_03405 [Flavobacterium sp.]|nr:MAG: hypothetical protein EOO45_03405 [Flavobacterium sp.]
MYNGLFDAKHKLNYVNYENPDRQQKLSTGIYDANVLCNQCDNEVLGKIESYVSIMIYGGNPGKNNIPVFKKYKSKDGRLIITGIANIDYTKMKLFLLSILWRAHISKHNFFEEIDLGPHAEKIRKMIIENDPKDDDCYESALTILKQNPTRPYKSIIQPRRLKLKHNTIYVFYINGIMYHYNVSPIDKLSMFAKGRVCSNNTMQIPLLEGDLADGYFDQYLGKRIFNPIKESLK